MEKDQLPSFSFSFSQLDYKHANATASILTFNATWRQHWKHYATIPKQSMPFSQIFLSGTKYCHSRQLYKKPIRSILRLFLVRKDRKDQFYKL